MWLGIDVRRTAVAGACVGACALLGAGTASAEPVLVSGPSPLATECSLNPRNRDIESEAVLAANPRDVMNLVAGWTQDAGEAVLVSSSHDGGASWTTVIPPKANHCSGLDRYNNAINPSVAFDAGGTAYLRALLDDTTAAKANGVEVSRSIDGGQTWDDAVVLKEDVGASQSDFPTVTGDAARRGTAYVTWQRLEGTGKAAWLSRTTDAGQTWSTPRVIASTPFGTLMAGDMIASIPKGSGTSAGDLILAYGQFDATQHEDFYVRRSHDRGTQWSDPVLALTGLSSTTQAFKLVAGRGGLVYLAVQAPVDATQPKGAILLATSRDGGNTWGKSPQVIVDADQVASDWDFAVAPDGILGVFYFANGETTTAWLKTSTDGGVTWQQTALTDPFTAFGQGILSGLAPLGDGRFGAAFVLSAPYSELADVFFARG